VKNENVANFQYDFTIKYYSHDVPSPIVTITEIRLELLEH